MFSKTCCEERKFKFLKRKKKQKILQVLIEEKKGRGLKIKKLGKNKKEDGVFFFPENKLEKGKKYFYQ